jgi:hypothetical protein
VAVVPDAYLNPPARGDDRLAELAEAGWGVVALPQTGLAPDLEQALLEGVADQLAVFLDDGYEVALAEPDDPAAARLSRLLEAGGRRLGPLTGT